MDYQGFFKMGGRTECNKWAEEIYWGHFQHIHFSQFLHSDFYKQLAIPKKFSDNLRKKLPDSVTLKGPGGGTWAVGVTTVGDAMFFKHGWQEFVSDHPLVENDFLVFRYNGESHFEVLMFDGKSLCEKEFSYFVKKKCEVVKQDQESSLNKIKFHEITCEEINIASSENVGCTSLEKSKDDNCIMTLSREQIVTPIVERKTRPKLPAIRPKRGRGSASKGSSSSRDLQEASNSNAGRTRRSGYGLQYDSNRREVSEDEKATALQLAQAAASKSSNEALLVIMKPSHVFKRFYVLLPTDWVSKVIALENQDLFLRVGDREWRTRFNYNRLRGSTGITSGWKHFAVDNNLDQFDVCMFKPSSPVNNSLCLDVQIFRVVPEFTPLTPRTPSKSGKRKKKEQGGEEEEEEEEDGDEDNEEYEYTDPHLEQ